MKWKEDVPWLVHWKTSVDKEDVGLVVGTNLGTHGGALRSAPRVGAIYWAPRAGAICWAPIEGAIC